MNFKKDMYLIGAMCLIGIILIFGLSWQTDPNLRGLPLIPSWLYNWTDSYKNSTIRTAVPFIALGLIIGGWLYIRDAPKVHFVKAWAILAGVVVLAEFGQYFIPSRDVDIRDIFWGSAGSIFGLGIMFCLLRFTRHLRKCQK